jgi:phage shock protein A
VRRDRDDIARMLIHKRITLESVCERMGDRMETLAMEKQTLLETLERQRLQYEECKTRAVVFCSRSGERPTESAGGPTCDAIGLPETTEEEVELELMQRKESLQQGGAA